MVTWASLAGRSGWAYNGGMVKSNGWALLLVWLVSIMSVSHSAWANDEVQAQLAESLPLIGVDRVHRELQITGSGVGVLVIDDWAINEEGFAHGQAVEEIVRAVAPGAQLWYCKLNFSQATAQDFSACLLSADGAHLPIRVVNLSLSVGEQVFEKPCDSLNDLLTRTIRYLSQKGVIFVAAAGNDGRKNALRYPACLPEVISVGATYDMSGPVEFDTAQVFCQDMAAVDKVTCYSNGADYLDLVAPGTTISTPSAPNFGGTSAAAPMVSGVIALMLEADPSLREHAILEKLQATAVPVLDPISSQTFLRVDAYRAVQAALSLSVAPPTWLLTIAQFDINDDGVIEDLEFFGVVDQWIASKITDDFFFDVIDYWVQQLPVRANDGEDSTQKAEKIQLYDLQGRLITEETGASLGRLRSLAPALANGVYIYVTTRELAGRLVRSLGKLVVLR